MQNFNVHIRIFTECDDIKKKKTNLRLRLYSFLFHKNVILHKHGQSSYKQLKLR